MYTCTGVNTNCTRVIRCSTSQQEAPRRARILEGVAHHDTHVVVQQSVKADVLCPQIAHDLPELRLPRRAKRRRCMRGTEAPRHHAIVKWYARCRQVDVDAFEHGEEVSEDGQHREGALPVYG